jgi:UDP-N-acetylmuramoylalanine-D-glutamate ligase
MGDIHSLSKQIESRQLNKKIVLRKNSKTVPIVSIKNIFLPGQHNLENYMAASAACYSLFGEACFEAVNKVAKSFKGVEHRIEFVREKDGVRYYNDSIASSPTRTIAGLHSFDKKVLLIAGGYDKHIPFDVLGPEIAKHVKAALHARAKSGFSNEMYKGMERALETELWLLLLKEGEFLTDEQHNSLNDDCVEMIRLTSAISKTSQQDD